MNGTDFDGSLESYNSTLEDDLIVFSKEVRHTCVVQCMDFEDSVTTKGTKEELSIEV
mgnify:CR=1 FL=1